MNHKFTSDGRKVAIVGALNAKETIVQEIFVNDGTEFPAGEHFVVKTLLDAPAETYKVKEERKLIESTKKLEAERDKLYFDIKRFRFASTSAMEKIKWIQGIKEPEVERVFDHIKSVLSGEYTHVVFYDYDGPQIKEWDAELFSKSEGYGEDRRFDGIRLVSLFGVWNGRLELDWRVNTYSDGSGSGRTSFTPCKSFQEAIEKAKETIDAKDHLSDKDFEFCIKYAIPVNETKNSERIRKKIERKEKEILETKKRLAIQESDLESIAKLKGDN